MSEKLKHCPFCGGEAEVVKDKNKDATEIHVECTECFCRTGTYINTGDRTDDSYSGFDYCVMCIFCIGHVDWCNTKEEAIEAWNRRVKNE